MTIDIDNRIKNMINELEQERSRISSAISVLRTIVTEQPVTERLSDAPVMPKNITRTNRVYHGRTRYSRPTRTYVQDYIKESLENPKFKGISPELDYKKIGKYAGISFNDVSIKARLYEELKEQAEAGVFKRVKINSGHNNRPIIAYKRL